LDLKEKKSDILLDIDMGLGARKNYACNASQANFWNSKFRVLQNATASHGPSAGGACPTEEAP
jgi:hypothetical protein